MYEHGTRITASFASWGPTRRRRISYRNLDPHSRLTDSLVMHWCPSKCRVWRIGVRESLLCNGERVLLLVSQCHSGPMQVDLIILIPVRLVLGSVKLPLGPASAPHRIASHRIAPPRTAPHRKRCYSNVMLGFVGLERRISIGSSIESRGHTSRSTPSTNRPGWPVYLV